MNKKVSTQFETAGETLLFSAVELIRSRDLGECDRDIYSNGTDVAMVHGGSSAIIERLVREAAEISGEKVDWHYAAGRGFIKTNGDAAKVKNAISKLTLTIAMLD